MYVLRLETEGYKPYARDAIELRADATIRLNAALLPEALQSQEVVVVARAPTVDVGSSSTGLNISSGSLAAFRSPRRQQGSAGPFESIASSRSSQRPYVSRSTAPARREPLPDRCLAVNNCAYA